MCSFRNEATSKTCPRWVKLNKSPVRFGAKGDDFGRFSYPENIFVRSMLVRRWGTVTCDKKNYRYWGCHSDHDLSVLLTDQNNKTLAPEASTVNKVGWYNLAGYSSFSSVLVFCAKKKPQCVLANSELRLWYGEDLRAPDSENDNGDRTCADVYGQLA